MKKRTVTLIIILHLAVIVLIAGIVLKYVEKKENRKQVIKANEEIRNLEKYDNIGYMVISKLNETYIISNREMITEVVKKLAGIEIEDVIKEDWSIDRCNKNMLGGGGYTAFKIEGYRSEEDDTPILNFWVYSNEGIRFGDKYKINPDSGIDDYLRDLRTYCIKPLPKLMEGSIFKYSNSENFGELDKLTVLQMYSELMEGSKPIHEEEFIDETERESFVSIETVNDEYIDMFYVDEMIYISYKIKGRICYFLYKPNY